MAHSSIIRKTCKCGCGKMPTMSCGGYNYACTPEEIKQKIGTRNKLYRKNKQKRLALTVKLKKVQKEVEGSNEWKLVLWFKSKMHISQKICENCSKTLGHYSDEDWMGCQHHIVDKALCPSVASHPDNHLVLGKYCCHSQWHTSFLNASRMPVFAKAKEKFLLFMDAIAESEIHKVNPYLF